MTHDDQEARPADPRGAPSDDAPSSDAPSDDASSSDASSDDAHSRGPRSRSARPQGAPRDAAGGAPAPRPTGRRPGEGGTREAILDAALDLFAANGIDATSMRAIAARAGVDPALVRHYHRDKESLFAQAVADRLELTPRVRGALAGDPAGRGERVAALYLGLWEDPDVRPVLLALVRSATTSEHAAELFMQTMAARIGPAGSPPMTAQRGMMLAVSHLIGVAIGRHIIRMPALVDAPLDELVQEIAPAIQRYLDATLADHPTARTEAPS